MGCPLQTQRQQLGERRQQMGCGNSKHARAGRPHGYQKDRLQQRVLPHKEKEGDSRVTKHHLTRRTYRRQMCEPLLTGRENCRNYMETWATLRGDDTKCYLTRTGRQELGRTQST